MSVKALTWAFAQEIQPAACKLLLLCLCDHADIENKCWPSIAHLAKRCGIEERSIFKYLTRLEKLGMVERHQRKGHSSIYLLLIDDAEKLPPPPPAKLAPLRSSAPTAKNAPTPAQNGGTAPAPECTQNLHLKRQGTVNDGKYAFEEGIIKLTHKTLSHWKSIFTNLNVEAELVGCADWASKQENWFFAVSAFLAKKDREQKVKIEAAKASGKPKPQTLEDIIG
jgi:hypothetical protein